MRNLLFPLLFLPFGTLAQQPFARTYSSEQGLPSNLITEVLQDRRGYVWLATGNGLCRFDGYTFTNLHAGGRQSDSNVLFLEEDQNGRLWFATLGRNLYFVEGDSILPFRHNQLIGEFTKNGGTPHSFHVAPSGDSLFLAVGQTGILAMDTAGHCRLIKMGNGSRKIIFEKDGQLMATQVGGNKLDENPALKVNRYGFNVGDRHFTLDFPPVGKNGPQVPVAATVGKDAYLVTVGKKLFFIKNQAWQRFSEIPERVMHLGQDSTGAIFMSLSNGAGLRRYANLEALQNGHFTQFAAGNSARWWYADRQGGWWVATQEQGVLYYPNPAVLCYRDFPEIGKNRPYSLAVKDDRAIFVGFGQGKVYQLNVTNNTISSLPPLPLPNTVYDLAYDQRLGRLWAATTYAQYFENGQWTTPPFPEDRGIPANRIWLTPNSELAFFSSQKGLTILDRASLDWYSSQNKFGIMAIDCAVEDFAGNTWTGKQDGLFLWNDEGFGPPALEHKAFGKAIQHLALMLDSAIVFSDGKDIYWWKEKLVRNLSTETATDHGLIAKLLVDAQGNIWFSSDDRLFVLKPEKNGKFACRLFGKGHGLPPGNIKAFDFYENKIWVATDGGVAALPDGHPMAPMNGVVLEKCWVNNKARNFTPGKIFPFDESNLTFQFTALNFRTADQSRYRYRLLSDEPWQETTDHILRFFSLGEGSYRLEIQAQNEEGTWGGPLILPFSIRPPFYRSWWFFSGLALLLAGGSFLWFRHRLKEVKKEASFKAQIASLERSALQAQMNPHFIFNCLSSIQNFILQNEKQQATQYLATFARLVRDTLDASVEGKVTLEDEVRMLGNYLSLERMRFKNKFSYEIVVAEGTDAFDLEMPPLLIQPFVENAVLHGMKNANGEGFIKITFEEKGELLEVVVEDNGSGVTGKDSANFENWSNQPAHKSVGMGITKKRLALLNDQGADSFQITQLMDEEGKVSGTRVTLRVKLNTA